MIDIDSDDFLEKFDIEKASVGVVGFGYVGRAIAKFFGVACDVVVYDKDSKKKEEVLAAAAGHPGGDVLHHVKRMISWGSLRDVVSGSDVVFVAVPTPMEKDGKCHTVVLEGALDSLEQEARRQKRSKKFVVVVKSTVPPGFTERETKKRRDLRLLFSPEFLTEKNSELDFRLCNRVILGGDVEDARIVFKFFEGVRPEDVQSDRLVLLRCDPTVAEVVKLYTNGLLATKVLFCNEIYQICRRLGISYAEVRALGNLDQRIGKSHTAVPGPDEHLGFGGSCFVKDMNNLVNISTQLKSGEKLFTAVLERNEELRPERDWESLEGRAVLTKK